ncbi:MAG: NAD-dependent epimerase/dehydratase family protein [Bryobacterales bacterium]|nr:NAD-dependent epimerase/dehydratase family protein [Bryobacterales bacterium]
MKPVLVTGATGFLGWHVAQRLVESGERVRALVRPSSSVRELDVETATGDLRDPASLERAVAGCRVVYHVAADYRLWAKDSKDLYRSNVDGTRNMLEAARQAGVERFVYTSTVGCIGIPSAGIGDEETPVSLADMTGHYKRSKFLAEQVALEYAQSGFPVYIVNPTAPVGDHDVKPTPTGKIIVDFLKGDMPAYVDTGLNLVDASDTARGHVLAAERGKPGERYILGGENMTLRQILEQLAQLSGKPAPKVRIPYAVAYAAGVCSTAAAHLTGKEPRAPLEGVRMARKKMWVSCDKAKRDLGFTAAPVEQALDRAIRWFERNGYC